MSLSRRCLAAAAVAFLALVSPPAAATQPLETFLGRAQAQSFDAREAAATERQRESESDVAFSRLMPTLSARGVYTRNQTEVATTLPMTTERLVITPIDQLDAFLQLDVPIIDLASYHRYRAAAAVAEGAAVQRGVTTIDVSRSVARAYYQFLGASALVISAEQSIGVAQANQRYVENRRAAGAATDLDYERAVASVARAEQDLADARLGAALSARALETLSGLSPEPPSGGAAADDLHVESPLEGWLDLARRGPATQALGHVRDAAEQERKATARSILPTLSASAQQRFTNATGFAGRISNYSVQLILSWRLDYSVLSAEPARAAALEAQQVRLERTERAAADAAFDAYQRVQAGIVKSRSARAQQQAAERAASLSVDRYEIGAATQLDVTQAQREAFLAEAALIQADSDLRYARAALRLAAGVPLTTKSATSAER